MTSSRCSLLLLAGTFFLVSTHGVGAAFAQQPADVALVSAAARALGTAKRSRLENTATDLGIASCYRVARRSDLKWICRQKSFTEAMEAEIETLLEQAMKMRGADKREALFSVIQEVSTDNFVHRHIDQWLGLPPRGDSPVLPEGGVALEGQVSVRYSGGGLRLELAESRLIDERGGAGQGNGTLDGGEWALLSLSVANASRAPYFSTSVYPTEAHPCLWVDGRSADPIAEIDPGEAQPGFDMWVYVSNECPADSALPITLMARDTHRTSGEGEKMSLELTVAQRTGVRLVDAQLDSDSPGHSDGSGLQQIQPRHLYEYSTGARVPGAGARVAMQDYKLPVEGPPLFSKVEHRPGAMYPLGAGLFGPYDDLDLETVEKKSFDALVREAQRDSRKRTFDGLSNELWLAVDLWAAYPLPTGQRQAAPPSAAPPPPGPLGPAELRALIEEYLQLIARPVPPRVKGAVAATDGYEIVIDWEALLGAYVGPTTPPPAPDVEVGETGYQHRLYVALPVKNIEARRPVATEQPRKVPAGPFEPDPTYQVRLDLGLGTGLSRGLNPAFLGQSVWAQNPATRPFLSWLLSVGPQHSFVFHLAGNPPGSHSLSNADGENPPLISELLVTGGYAFQGRVNDVLEIAPRLGVGVRVMKFEGDLGEDISSFDDLSVLFTVDLGLTARFMVWEHFGFHLDLGVVAGSPWFLTDSEEQDFQLLGMGQGRVGGGLSLRF